MPTVVPELFPVLLSYCMYCCVLAVSSTAESTEPLLCMKVRTNTQTREVDSPSHAGLARRIIFLLAVSVILILPPMPLTGRHRAALVESALRHPLPTHDPYYRSVPLGRGGGRDSYIMGVGPLQNVSLPPLLLLHEIISVSVVRYLFVLYLVQYTAKMAPSIVQVAVSLLSVASAYASADSNYAVVLDKRAAVAPTVLPGTWAYQVTFNPI